jgi:hypothetical protein
MALMSALAPVSPEGLTTRLRIGTKYLISQRFATLI